MGEYYLNLDHDIDLKKTMDIEIPALEWIPFNDGFQTVWYINGKPVYINMKQIAPRKLYFCYDDKYVDDEYIHKRIRNLFPFYLDQVNTGSLKIIQELANYYRNVAYMKSIDPFRSLIVTILSQNKTGEATRSAFFNLAKNVEISPLKLSEIDENYLRNLIREAGPYKAKFIIKISEILKDKFGGNLSNILLLPTDEALKILTSLPGVGHKTAACVIVYAALKKDILPVDTHLRRVTYRIGLYNTDIPFSKVKKEVIINHLLSIIPDAGYAHLYFVLLGREFCHSRKPLCNNCPINNLCKKRI